MAIKTMARIVSGGKKINRKVRKVRPKFAGVPLYPLTVETEYRKELLARLRYARMLVQRYLVPALSPAKSEVKENKQVIKEDAATDRLIGIMEQIRTFMSVKYTRSATMSLAEDVAAATSIFNLRQTMASAKRVTGIDPTISEPYLTDELQSFAFFNARLISDLPEKYLTDIENKTFNAVLAGTRAEEIAAEMQDAYGISERRAALIARDQIGKLNGQLNAVRLQNLGSSRYRWLTVGDERVRDAHAERNGQVFLWDDPPEGGHPGEDYNCRCIASPIFDDQEVEE